MTRKKQPPEPYPEVKGEVLGNCQRLGDFLAEAVRTSADIPSGCPEASRWRRLDREPLPEDPEALVQVIRYSRREAIPVESRISTSRLARGIGGWTHWCFWVLPSD